MAIHDIVKEPDPVLHRVAEPVSDFSDDIKILANDLQDTLNAHGGIGLSAPQIARSIRILVLNIDDVTEKVFVNPTVTSKSAIGFVQESCLSLPGVVGSVWRATKITVEAQDTNGQRFEQRLEGMAAVCIQHEIDHLDGILFTERFSTLKKCLLRVSAILRGEEPVLASRTNS